MSIITGSAPRVNVPVQKAPCRSDTLAPAHGGRATSSSPGPTFAARRAARCLARSFALVQTVSAASASAAAAARWSRTDDAEAAGKDAEEGSSDVRLVCK